MLQSNSGFADVHGTQLYFEVAGTGQALVLLHEGIADHRMWDAQFAEFARQYRVVRYDARGFGHSPMPPEPFFRHEDLRGLLEALGIDHAILPGASMGGATALDAALTYPQMVDALVLAASGLGGCDFSDETKQKWAEIDAAYERDGVAQAVELELQMWVDGPFRTPDQVDPAVGGVQSRRAQLPAHVSESERLMISSRPPKLLTARDRCPRCSPHERYTVVGGTSRWRTQNNANDGWRCRCRPGCRATRRRASWGQNGIRRPSEPWRPCCASSKTGVTPPGMSTSSCRFLACVKNPAPSIARAPTS